MVSSHTDPLRYLAGKLGMAPGAEPERIQKKLMDCLGPMVRVALRRGVGQPALLRWLRHQLGGGDESEGGSRDVASGHSGPRRLVDRSLPEGETNALVETLARLLLAPERAANAAGAETVLGA